MSVCVVQQPDGSLIATTDSPQSCQGYLMLSPQEVAALQPMLPPLSLADGALISSTILLLWASALG
jgi:hypothetical protein